MTIGREGGDQMRAEDGNAQLRRVRGMVPVLAFSAIGFVAWALADYQHERNAHRQALVTHGAAVLHAVEAGIQSHGWGGRFERSGLQVVFEEIVANPFVLGLALDTAAGERVLAAGTVPRATAAATPTWIDRERLLLSTSTDLTRRPRRGGGRGPGWGPPMADRGEWIALPEGPASILVLLDARPYRATVARAQARFAASIGAGLLVLGLLANQVRSLRREVALRDDLAETRAKADRLAMLSQLATGLAHETRNPLGVIRGLAQRGAELDADSGLSPERARQIIDEVDRTVGQINAFLEYARPPAPQLAPIDLGQLVAELVELMQPEAMSQSVGLRVTPARPSPALADVRLLRQALMNLILNAVQACPPGGAVTLLVEPRDGAYAIAVSDTGRGIAPADLPHVTEPYFSRRDGGTGLGLSIVQQIVEAHRWQLDIRSASGQGTVVRIAGISRAPAS